MSEAPLVLRPGIRVLYEPKPGEKCEICANGSIVITHPDRPPKILIGGGGKAVDIECEPLPVAPSDWSDWSI